MFWCIIKLESNGAGNESEMSGIWRVKRIKTALLGHGVTAIERWRVGEVNDNWVLGRILSWVTTKKRGAHVDTSRDEFSLVSRQRWERLMGRLEQSRNS
jgi:hypothetical protein